MNVQGISATERGNLHFVTGLRGLAAIFVLLSHVWYQIWPAVPAPYGYGLHPTGMTAQLTGWLYYGHFGVVVFIVLSGFCLTLPTLGQGYTLSGGVIRFLQRRARRILPPYYFAMAFSLLLIYFAIGDKTASQWDISIPITNRGVISHLLLLQDFIDSTQINYVFWSIAVEVHLYFLFPLLMWGWRRMGVFITTVSACGMIYAIIGWLEWIGFNGIPPHFIGLCAYFIFGMACAASLYSSNKICVAIRSRIPWEMMTLLFAMVVIVLCNLWGSEIVENRFALVDPFCALATVAALQASSQSCANNRIKSLLENRLLVKAGLFSYSLYLIHAPILQLVWWYAIVPLQVSDTTQFCYLLIFGSAASLITAKIFFLLCEKPFLSQTAPIVQKSFAKFGAQ